jgi:tyrosyl-tRNA synthetase
MLWHRKSTITTDDVKLEEFLTRGVERVFPSKEFVKERLKKGGRLTMYLGIDPTGPALHLGHIIAIRKLAQFQKLGHRAILLIGDFTAMIGDPTDKSAARKKLTRAQVLSNCRNYKKQASVILNFHGSNKAELKFNSTWLGKLSFEETLDLMSHVTHSQTVKRDMFQERIASGKELYLHEFMYPLMQGYDSVAMDVDGEVGGNDQTFNMLTGRDLMKTLKNKDKFVIAMKLLTDSSGKKMGKTEGNMVSLDQTPADMFGKVMSWTDGLIAPGFELLTDVPSYEIKQMLAEMERGSNPKDYKMRLAQEIVTMIHGAAAGEKARQTFDNTFKKGEVPQDVIQILTNKSELLRDVLVKEKVVASNGDWKRLVDGNAVYQMDPEARISDYFVKVEETHSYKIGKKRFVRVVVK